MVLELAKRAEASIYISGTGCKDFIVPEEFEDIGIQFRFNEIMYKGCKRTKNHKEYM